MHKDWMTRTYILACAGIVGDRIIPDMTFVARRIGVDALKRYKRLGKLGGAANDRRNHSATSAIAENTSTMRVNTHA